MRRSLPALALLCVVVACSGAVDPHGLLGGGGPATGGGQDAAPEAASSSSGGGTSSGGSSGGVSSSSGGTHADSGTTIDASTIDSSPLPEASPVETGPAPGTFSCPPGGTACGAPEVCCATNTGQGNTPVYRCQATTKPCGSTASAGTPISCSSSADCHNGELCCGDNQNGFYTDVVCQATCQGPDPSGQGQYVQFCDLAAADCVGGAACVPSQVLQGFDVCQ